MSQLAKLISRISFRAPLNDAWSPQYAHIHLKGIRSGQRIELMDGEQSIDFQYTGSETEQGAEVVVKLGFAADEIKHLSIFESETDATSLDVVSLPIQADTRIGVPGSEVKVSPAAPLLGFAGHDMDCTVHCDVEHLRTELLRVNEGPLFVDYRLVYDYQQNRRYQVDYRCYKQEPWVEVTESFSLGMNAQIRWVINPDRQWTHLLTDQSFERQNQPQMEALGAVQPRDILCRLQMPALSEYYIPKNHGWFAFHDQRQPTGAMLGILGLYGAAWQEPVVNMPIVYDSQGTARWEASLASGRRHWLLVNAPFEAGYTAEHRLLFHRLHAEFNALRLDELLDSDPQPVYDASCYQAPGFFDAGDIAQAAQERVKRIPFLQAAVAGQVEMDYAICSANFKYLTEPSNVHAEVLYATIVERFERWVAQFQGYRDGRFDYMLSVIGFARFLRGMLIGYEMLRRNDCLDARQVRRLNDYFIFAAGRILDEGRWPHSRTWKHPLHPESSRDFYTYGGEHVPDRLVWTNCLPNFQSDAMCALLHIAAMFKDHPDARDWRQFALDDIDRQLDAYCGESGAWCESGIYVLYTLSYFIITFKVLKARCGIDYFQDERLRRVVEWLYRFLGPNDKRWGKYTWPGVGNVRCPTDGGEYLLCYAGALPETDPLRAKCIAIWQRLEANCLASSAEHYPTVLAVMAPEVPTELIPLKKQVSENMAEVGVAMRHAHLSEKESYLFQKIGFAKDHFENDETSFNWYAKGTPLCMDYGTYTSAAQASSHNCIEIPDMDSLTRGYLADQILTAQIDYTHCEMPVGLKLLWGRVRSFEEVDDLDSKTGPSETPYYYIGDPNPVGPKTWKVRKLLYVKPDYIVLFDRVYGQVPHRYNLHTTGDLVHQDGQEIQVTGRFDLNLRCFMQHPVEFKMESGVFTPRSDVRYAVNGEEHAQSFFRIYNQDDGIYRSVLFAEEKERSDVHLSSVGSCGIRVETDDYIDYVFIHDEVIEECLPGADGIAFRGKCGWIRQHKVDGIQACMIEGEGIAGFGKTFEGRGAWDYNLSEVGQIKILSGPPREVQVR